MNDAQILDWLEAHYTRFCEDGVRDEERFTLSVIGGRRDYDVTGPSLRDCVLKATGRERHE